MRREPPKKRGRNKNCIVPGCKTGLKSNRSVEKAKKISSHGFPRTDEMIEKWKLAIPGRLEKRGQPINVRNSIICSLHFKEDDFRTEAIWAEEKLKKRRLVPTAVPSLFPNSCEPVSFKSVKPPAPKIKKSHTEVKKSLSPQVKSSTEGVKSLDELEERISPWLPSGVISQRDEESLNFFYITKNLQGVPCLHFSLTINKDLTHTAYVNGKKALKYMTNHLVNRSRIEAFSEVLAILSLMKEHVSTPTNPVSEAITDSISTVQSYLPNISDKGLTNSLSFLMEQARLSFVPKKERNYSPTLVSSAAVWGNISPSLYRYLHREGLLCLPPVRYLKNFVPSSPIVKSEVSEDNT